MLAPKLENTHRSEDGFENGICIEQLLVKHLQINCGYIFNVYMLCDDNAYSCFFFSRRCDFVCLLLFSVFARSFQCRFAFDMFAFFFPPSHRISFSTALFFHYYHLNINVVGYNSVGFIILCTERTAHSGHLYRSLIHYAWMGYVGCSCLYLCMDFCMFEQFCYWLALEIAETFKMFMLLHTHSNYSSNKNTGNISEKSEIKLYRMCVYVCVYAFFSRSHCCCASSSSSFYLRMSIFFLLYSVRVQSAISVCAFEWLWFP